MSVTAIFWPQALPIPKIGGLNGKYKDPVIRTQMDAGPSKARRRFTAVPKAFKAQLVLREDKRALLEAFWKDSLGYGTLRFKMKNPQTGKVEEFRMTEPPDENGNDDGLYEVTLTLERMP